LVAVLAGALWAGPQAFHYIENKLSNPQQAVADPAETAPYVTEITPPAEPVSVAPASAAPPIVASVAPAPPKPSVKPKPVAASVKPPSAAPPTPPPAAVVLPPKAMAHMDDVEVCLRQIARTCDVNNIAEFRPDGQFSASERRLLGMSLFPDGAQPTQDNLAACKAGSTRRALTTDQGKAICTALRQQ
jgi:hypothetical protein